MTMITISLDATSGASMDWAYEQDIPISYTLELRDKGKIFKIMLNFQKKTKFFKWTDMFWIDFELKEFSCSYWKKIWNIPVGGKLFWNFVNI